jgi:hypothetical protein
MGAFQFEISKITTRRFSVILMLATVILFPAMVKVISHLEAGDGLPEGLFADKVVYSTILFSQTYFFLPVWIIVFVGQELSNGHVNRVVFIKGKKFYFLSKLYFCVLVTAFFSILGLIAIMISLITAPYPGFTVAPSFYFKFILQMVSATFAFSCLLLCVVFVLRSPVVSFVIYFAWTFVETMAFLLFKGVYKIELYGLPFHMAKGFFVRRGEVKLENYYYPFVEDPMALIAPTVFIPVIVYATWRYFSKSDLKPLSD